MPKYKKKGLAAGVDTVEAVAYNGYNHRDVAATLGLPWFPGRGTHAAMTDPQTGELLVISRGSRVPVAHGQWVVKSNANVEVLEHSTFQANYDKVES